MTDLEERLRGNSYPGRGIVAGLTADGRYAATAYFIMGRSVNSRNRVFVKEGEGIRTQAFDPSKMQDPSLIIYAPVRVLGHDTIVTNGDQTDTVFDGLSEGKSFEEALRSRTFEPDAPNYTPRISALLHTEGGRFSYQLSILKSDCGDPASCLRYLFRADDPLPGKARFLSTYSGDGTPLPSFQGEPHAVTLDDGITDSIDVFTQRIWDALNEDNRVSLFTRFISAADGKYESRIVNKNI
ncbi:MAG: IMP cyclohydrolase [Lachnospiraceae bacterium]|jgi:IMP cyclohydrolase|nr:IMP cyclohydrolase [Lachnospiraceae bacterium]